MNIYDKAHELASELKENSEVREFKVIAEKIKDNKNAQNMLKDFRKLQFEAYSEQMAKGEISKATKEKLESLGSVVSINPDVSKYLNAEAKFGVIWEDIMKILSDAIGVDMNLGIK